MEDDIAGKKFGKWSVIRQSETKKSHYTCECSCGTVKDVCASTLRLGKTTSCGLCRTAHKKVEVGDTFLTNQGCECVVLEYNGAFDVVVKFNDEQGHIKTVTTGELRCGEVANPFFPSVFGVGYPGIDKGSSDGYKLAKSREHLFWKGIMERCYSEKSQQRSPSYIGCVVAEEWHNFQNFAHWCQDQVGFNEKGWHLDKDLLATADSVRGYSPENCVFVPQEVNTLFIIPVKRGSDLPLGVSYCKDRGKYQAGCGSGGVRKGLGRFNTPELAYEAYLAYKKVRVKEVAIKYEGRLDKRVSELLYKFIED